MRGCRMAWLGAGVGAAAAAVIAACAQRQEPGVVRFPQSQSARGDAGLAGQALHNLHRLNERVISGSGPQGPAAFDELAGMGVRTIISVDGGMTDVAAAEARGMRYVHVPVTYATISEAQRLEIARALRDLEGPVYIHCHHGLHRGPAAAAAAAVALGWMSAEAGVEFMRRAGTADSYTGLYACVGGSRAATAAELDAASDAFPPVRRAEGLVAAMVEIDFALENLGEIRAAGWKTPAAHPDLVAAAEAGRLADNLRFSGEDPKSSAKGDEYLRMLREAIEGATALEEAIVRRRPEAELEMEYARVKDSCKSCHSAYRN